MQRVRNRTIAGWAVGVILIGLYAYALIAAIGNAIGMPQVAESLGLGLSAAGLAWITVGIIIPPLILALALVLGRGRSMALKLLLLAAGICLVAGLQLDIMHVVPRMSYFG